MLGAGGKWGKKKDGCHLVKRHTQGGREKRMKTWPRGHLAVAQRQLAMEKGMKKKNSISAAVSV